MRTLPMRVEPWPGESLQSWVEQLAVLYDATVGDIADRLALPPVAPHQWSERLPAQHIEAVAHATGVSAAVVKAMTLEPWAARWAGDGSNGGVQPAPPSKHCGRCLLENGGRWLLCWRLPMHLVCQRHQVLLKDGCGSCGRPIRGDRDKDRGLPSRRRCGARCRNWKSSAHVVVPHGTVQAAGAAFLQDVADAAAHDRFRTAGGVLLPPNRLYAEARLLAERIKSALHPHDVLDARRSGRWEPADVCGRQLFRDPYDPGGLYGWALAATALLAEDVAHAADAIRWLVARERRPDRFPRTKYEHLQMAESLGPVMMPILTTAIEQVDEPCPDAFCERVLRVLQRPSGAPLKDAFEHPEDAVWAEPYDALVWKPRFSLDI